MLDLVRQHPRIAHRVQCQERLREARREGRLGLGDAVLGAGHLGCVTGDEVEHGLGAVELRDGRQHAAGVAGEQDDVARVVAGDAGDFGIVDVFDWVGTVWSVVSMFCWRGTGWELTSECSRSRWCLRSRPSGFRD